MLNLGLWHLRRFATETPCQFERSEASADAT
jgi:hypothetical protein